MTGLVGAQHDLVNNIISIYRCGHATLSYRVRRDRMVGWIGR